MVKDENIKLIFNTLIILGIILLLIFIWPKALLWLMLSFFSFLVCAIYTYQKRSEEESYERWREQWQRSQKSLKQERPSAPSDYEKSEFEKKYPLVHSATGGRIVEARRLARDGINHFNNQAYKTALESLETASKRTPRDESVWAAMVPILLLLGDCRLAKQVSDKANNIDEVSLPARLAATLYKYHCGRTKADEAPPQILTTEENESVPPILVVPVDGTLIKVEFGTVPESSRKWWGEGIRSIKRGKHDLARTMFQAAIFEYKEFPHAWIGLSNALRTLGFKRKAEAAQSCSKMLLQGKELDDDLVRASGLPALDQWLYAITLYRIIFEYNLRPLI